MPISSSNISEREALKLMTTSLTKQSGGSGHSYYTSGPGETVVYSANVIGLNDSQDTQLQATDSGGYAWVIGEFNTSYSREVSVRAYSSTLYSYVTIAVSNDDSTWTSVYTGPWSASSLT